MGTEKSKTENESARRVPVEALVIPPKYTVLRKHVYDNVQKEQLVKSQDFIELLIEYFTEQKKLLDSLIEIGVRQQNLDSPDYLFIGKYGYRITMAV